MSEFAYIGGLKGVWVICDRCGEKKRREMISKEWTGSMVCRSTCLDPRPPEMSPPKVWPEGTPIPDSRPRPTDTFITPGPIDPNSL